MLPLELPAIDPGRQPPFRDPRGCEQWLAQLQLTNVSQTHALVCATVDELNQSPLAPAARLALMEALRETVTFLQSEQAKRLLGKPLPYAEREAATLAAIVSLWRAMAAGYGHCLHAALEGDRALAKEQALLCQRALACTAQQILEQVEAGYDFDPGLWQQLNGFYKIADELGVAQAPVADPLAPGAPATCTAAYLRALLIVQANPYELGRRQIGLIERWLGQWAGLARLALKAAPAGEGPPALEINLSAAAGLRRPESEGFSTAVRYLDASLLSKELRVKSVLLSQGQSPAQLGLGQDCEQPDCGELLNHLYQKWCEGQPTRQFERVPAQGTAQVCFGIPAIHYYLSGKPFTQPRRGGALSEREEKDIAALGHKVSETDRLRREGKTALTEESWQIEDRSALGLRLILREESGERITAHRIMAARSTDREGYQLGVIRWVMVGRDGGLRAGLRILPGQPQAGAVRATGINVPHSEKFVPALLLPELATVQIPPSLVVPAGTFEPKRVVELYAHADKSFRNVMLQYVIEKGVDFERVSFAPA